MKPFNIDKIIYPVKTKRGIKMAPPEAYHYQDEHVN